MNAIVSSPAGNSASQRSPERMTAIGRVFENQGKYPEAQAMYRKALSADPNSQIARERIDAIASMNSKRSFDPSTAEPPQSMFAVADALNRNDRKPKRLTSRPAKELVEPAKIASQNEGSLVSSLVPPVPDIPLPTINEPKIVVAGQAEDLTQVADVQGIGELAVGELDIVDSGRELGESFAASVENAAAMTLSFAPAEKVSEISAVVFEGEEDSVSTIATIDDSWKPSRQTVSLEDVLEWSDCPEANTDNLLLALTNGQNDSVKAFAATLLVECPADNPEINAALRNVDTNVSAMLKLSSRDTLIQRGELDDQIVNDLLGLLSDSDTNVQSQAAASLRNIAGTQWATQCVGPLTQMLSHGNSDTHTVAAATLGDFGADAISSRSLLMNLAINSDNESTRAAAELALNRIPEADGTLPPVEIFQNNQTEDDQSETVLSIDGYLPIVE